MSLAPGPLLAGKTTVVTGGGGGAGRAIAEAFAAHGATVVIADRDAGRAAQVADNIAATGGKVIPVIADVTRPADVRRVAELGGEVDILVNSAGPGLGRDHAFLDSTVDDWQTGYEMNLKHVLLCCRAVIPGMVERGRGGSVINVATVGGVPAALTAAFNGGVVPFTRNLAMELGPHRIRVNTIGRPVTLGEPDDYAGVALFLASDLSASVTGVMIPAGVRSPAGADAGWTPGAHLL